MSGLYRAAAGIDSLERLAMGDSPVHRLHPMAKLAVTVAYVAVVLSFPSRNVSGLMAIFFYPAIVMPLSGTPYRPLLGRLLIALPFSLMGGLANVIVLRGAAFHVGGFTVSQGMLSLVSILLKTLLTVLAVLILAATTPFVEIVHRLSRLGVPKIVCLQFVMTCRYLSVLLDEAGSMRRAYALRAPAQKGVKMRDIGSFLGQLILRAFDRAARVHQAMKCRGFQGLHPGRARGELRWRDFLCVGVLLSAMLVLRFFNLSLFFGRLVG
ncbi:MAG: cobalt ECF transporter T component CbiQ [Synergistaceae bacterium]|jgi:cobalt/nickel transport system permease protein|nr:cobalt ECF transporter T component CbiQ [Synergistaceae bacterium]